MNPNNNYQASYTTIAYTDPIPLPDSSAGFLSNSAYHNVMWHNTLGQPKFGGFSYETPPQFMFISQPIDMTPAQTTGESGVNPNNLTNQLATILRESFNIEPKGPWCVYQKSYPNYYDQLPYPRGYRVSEFSKFSRDGGKITLEHADQFILQCGESSANYALKLIMFLFIFLQKIHEYFYSGDINLRLSHLTVIKQKQNEPFTNYIRRFKHTKNQCFNLNIFDKDLAYLRLSPHLKDKLDSNVFSNVSQVL
jgi:hypothetical protein